MENLATDNNQKIEPAKNNGAGSFQYIVSILLLVLVILIGGYLRFTGMNWDESQHLHPDERFLTMVESGIQPVKNLALYFDTAQSTLNPHNVGYGYYVYGTLPIFIIRYLADFLKQSGYDQVFLVGRYASAFVDLLTVILVFLIVEKMYKKPLMAALAAAFSAFSVMQIEQSHYFTTDTFTNFFSFLAFYFAVRVMMDVSDVNNPQADQDPELFKPLWKLLITNWRGIGDYILFGISLGMAMASKVSVYFVPLLLVMAVVIRYCRLAAHERRTQFFEMGRNLVIAAFFGLLFFRIFQPYAFQGPGFFDIGINPKWLANLQELVGQSNGDIDVPYAFQWARRPIWFAFENMVLWGLGLPLGILAWSGFLWMGWRMFKGEWKKHLLVWVWTALFFVSQSRSFNPTMRYLLYIYPSLAMISAWTVFSFWDLKRKGEDGFKFVHKFWAVAPKAISILLGLGVLGATVAWAYGFAQIYNRPVTRVAASEWIYQNVPGPMNLKVEAAEGTLNQPLSFRSGLSLLDDKGVKIAFTTPEKGVITDMVFPHVLDPLGSTIVKTMTVLVSEDAEGKTIIGAGTLSDSFSARGSDSRGNAYTVVFDQKPVVQPGQRYYFIFRFDVTGLSLASTITYHLLDENGEQNTYWLPDPVDVVKPDKPFQMTFTGLLEGSVTRIEIPHIVDWEANVGEKTLLFTILDSNKTVLSTATTKGQFLAVKDPRGEGLVLTLDKPLSLEKSHLYTMTINMAGGDGAIGIYGARPALESTWDDAIPLQIDGFNAFDYSSGIYRSDLNFEMYWDDNPDKLTRFKTILDQADYIYITSNRQYASITRVPERYPLTSVYYRNLIGCPAERDIIECYYVATPGMFNGNLGFELVHTAQSEPTIGPFTFNSQFAEEAFTVYDHPKVLIFKKTDTYSAEKVDEILSKVDLSTAVHVTPRQASNLKSNMMLPEEKLEQQQAGGTWSEIFNRLAVINQIPAVGVVLWYLVILLLGWVNFPLVRFVFSGLPDKGFPLTRLVGLLLLAYLTWVAGSLGLAFSMLSISGVFGLILVGNGGLFWLKREEIVSDIRENWKRYLTVELVFLSLFIVFLLVRLGNPDLWHPAKGGEKPMDFSFLNAVIKSTTFPPYDPWYAGGYINYYYFGFVLAAVPIKWIGLIPSIAYNLILPTFFAFLGVAAFSVGWNLLWAFRFTHRKTDIEDDDEEEEVYNNRQPLYAGLLATTLSLLIGNLGSIRMIWYGFMRLANGNYENGNPIEKIIWTFQGIGQFFSHAQLPYGAGDWYWIPSRIYPGEPITEFPLFTFLYADPHAHLFALPFTMLALSWAISILLQKWTWDFENRWLKSLQVALTFIIGGMVIGCLYPTNTWDMPVYLVLGCLTVFYTVLNHTFLPDNRGRELARIGKKLLLGIFFVGILAGLSFLLYRPFSQWFVQAYSSMEVWKGNHTALTDYLTHWGVFMFILISWFIWETIDWMDKTPLSHLRLVEPYMGLLGISIIAFVVIIVLLQVTGVQIAWFVLILALWALILLLRPNQPDQKKFVLFLVGTGLALTLAVELIVLKGDYGRMNTVFKFYIQTWILFAVSSAAGLTWLYPAVKRWHPAWSWIWSVCLGLFIGFAALFTLLGTMGKITDRMTNLVPVTLDGMEYMKYAHYSDAGQDMDLEEDYLAIRWMQDNVKGSPVIVEANATEYKWGSRFTIYTGLPGVVGWNWHERQQRAALNTEAVFNRVEEVGKFYNTPSIEDAQTFLEKYRVKYIIVGQLESAMYGADGLQKFKTYSGKLWDVVYQNGHTVIYQVK